MTGAPPKVFISYSHDNEAHKARVLALADRLRHAGGVEAIIDRYVPFPEEGWPLWCEKQIDEADFVLMVCTEAYLRRVRNEEIRGTGLGVLWEAQLIRQELYDSGSVSAKFVPVRFADSSDAHIPRPVRRFSRYIVDHEADYEALYRYLTDQPATPPPQIGGRQVLSPAPRPGLADAPVALETPKSAEPALSQPHPRVEDVFVGREADLKKLAAFLFPEDGRRRPVVVSGMAGVGKSYLADRFFAENKARFPGGYIRLALDPENLAPRAELLAQIAYRLKLPPGDADVVAARLREPLSLVHVENVDTGDAEAVVGALAQDSAGCALIASARVTTLGTDTWWRTVPLQSFDDDTALDQLARELELAEPQRDVLGPLVQALGGLPMALHLAAGHLRFGETPESFLALLRGKGLAIGPVSRADPTFRERSRQLLSGTFDLSLNALAREGGEGWRIALHALGFAPAAGFGESLGAAIAGLSVAEFGHLRRAAGALSLLDRVPRGKAGTAFHLHPLLAELGRGRVDKDAVIDRMTEWFVARLPEGGEEQGQRWQEVHEETAALIEWLPQVPEPDRARVQRTGRQFARINGPFHSWLRFCQGALTGTRSDEERSEIMLTLCVVARRGGLPDRALAAAEQKARIGLETRR